MTRFTKKKKDTKHNTRIISKAQVHLKTIENHVQSSKKKKKKKGMKLYEELCSRGGTHCLEVPTVYILRVKHDKFTMRKIK